MLDDDDDMLDDDDYYDRDDGFTYYTTGACVAFLYLYCTSFNSSPCVEEEEKRG